MPFLAFSLHVSSSTLDDEKISITIRAQIKTTTRWDGWPWVSLTSPRSGSSGRWCWCWCRGCCHPCRGKVWLEVQQIDHRKGQRLAFLSTYQAPGTLMEFWYFTQIILWVNIISNLSYKERKQLIGKLTDMDKLVNRSFINIINICKEVVFIFFLKLLFLIYRICSYLYSFFLFAYFVFRLLFIFLIT